MYPWAFSKNNEGHGVGRASIQDELVEIYSFLPAVFQNQLLQLSYVFKTVGCFVLFWVVFFFFYFSCMRIRNDEIVLIHFRINWNRKNPECASETNLTTNTQQWVATQTAATTLHSDFRTGNFLSKFGMWTLLSCVTFSSLCGGCYCLLFPQATSSFVSTHWKAESLPRKWSDKLKSFGTLSRLRSPGMVSQCCLHFHKGRACWMNLRGFRISWYLLPQRWEQVTDNTSCPFILSNNIKLLEVWYFSQLKWEYRARFL